MPGPAQVTLQTCPRLGRKDKAKMDAQPQEGTAHATPNGCKASATKRHSKAEDIPKPLGQDLEDTCSAGRLFTPSMCLRFTANDLVLGTSTVQRPPAGSPRPCQRFARSMTISVIRLAFFLVINSVICFFTLIPSQVYRRISQRLHDMGSSRS